jgi:hypothetical protein
MLNPSLYYLGCMSRLLEPITLEYKWFGALWTIEDAQQIVVGYWFGHRRNDITQKVNELGVTTWNEVIDIENINGIYNSIREKQKEMDWTHRARLPLYTNFKLPWKHVLPGWYLIRSRNQYPLHVSAVQRKRYFIWLEHAAICENEKDLMDFLQKVNQEHQIELQKMN